MASRTATLFNRSGTALGNSTYPSALGAGEEIVYQPGVALSWEFEVKATRNAAGNPVKGKFQGTTDPPDALTLGGGAASVKLLALAAGSSARLAQAAGASVAISHSFSGGLLVVTLGTDATGKPSTTGAALQAYVNANLPGDFLASAGGAGIMGATDLTYPVPLAPDWNDLLSLRQDTGVEVSEHTIDAGAGASVAVGFALRDIQGWRAIRFIGTGAGAPNAGDALSCTTAVPGGWGE